MKIDINANIHLDEVKYALQINLTNKQLVNFVMSLGDNLNDPYEFYDLLGRKLNKLKQDNEESNNDS